jgi:hypothetical protein
MQWFRRPERHASQTRHVSPFGVDADALADVPAGHVASNASDPANRLVPHDESAEVDLCGLGGVQVTSADAAQVYVDEHLIATGCRRRAALEADAAIAPQHHRCHLGRSGRRSTGRIGRT